MKRKVWDITVKDNPNRVGMCENDDFYTTDTEAFLVFNLKDKFFMPQSAMITLENRSDGSLKSEEVEVVGGNITWEMPERYIEHFGNWQAQIVYETKESGQIEKYTSGVMSFNVNAHIGDKKKPSLVEIENWEKFIREGTELIETWEDLEALREENERQRQENYQELLDTGVLQTNINEKLEDLEGQYAPKLTEVTAQLAKTVDEVNKATSELTEDSEVILARGGETTLGVRLDKMEEAQQDGTQVIDDMATSVESTYSSHKIESLLDEKAGKSQGEWISPTLLNGWTQGNAGTSYFKDEFGIVHLNVSASSGSGTIFILPAGYRPSGTREFWCNSGAGHGILRVLSNGMVSRLVGSGDYIISSGITFKVEG